MTHRVRVKICGVRTIEEAQSAINAGADALGFNCWPQSARYIAPETARDIIAQLSPLVPHIGVFVNEDGARIKRSVATAGLSAVQLHGDESPEDCRSLDGIRIIKAFRVGPDFDCAVLQRYPINTALLDTNIKGRYGGTGERFDWRIAVKAKQFARIILAGGITIDNVFDAITSVRPFAIDVCSGVEAEPGRKDLIKLREFMSEVEHANARLAEENHEQG
jgi:phosphoribosylanthranilate isomerase